MGLWYQVQYLEERVLMLENFILEFVLHTKGGGIGGGSTFPQYRRPPPRQPGNMRPANSMPWLQTYNPAHDRPQLEPEVSEIGEISDDQSLADSLAGLADTEVSGPGGFGVGNDMGGLGDLGGDVGGNDAGDAGDAGAGDAGDSGGDAGSGDGGGMD